MDRHWVVDRIEGRRVVLIDDAGRTAELDLGVLPVAPREGMVLRMATTEDGHPDPSSAARDPEAEHRLLEEAKVRLERLRKQDPGGNIII